MNSPQNLEQSTLNQALDVRIEPELLLKWQTILSAAQIETLVTTSQLKIEFTSANQDQYQQLQTFVENHHIAFIESNQWQLYLATAFIEIDHPPTNLKIFAPWIVCPLTITFSDHIAHFQIENPALNEQLLTKLQDLNRLYKLVFEVPKIDQDLVSTINNNPAWNLSQIYQTETDFSSIAPLGGQISFKPHQILLIINFNPQRSHLGVQLTKLKQSLPDYENQLLNNGSFDPHVAKQKIIDLMIDQRGQYLYKIMPTNYSQDCAILSALNFHTFIDGPPGTGKTQCLTNLLVNIMLNQATAIVSSQKQVALDILSDKLEILNTFVLHLNKNFLIKSNFYHHIRQSLHSAWQYQPQIQPLQKTFNYDQREWLMIDHAYNKRHDQSAIDQNTHQWFEKNIQYESTFIKWLEVNHFEITPQSPNNNDKVPKQRRRWWKRNKTNQSQQVQEQNHPRYQQYLTFQAVFPNATVYQEQQQLYQYWNTTLNQAQTQGDQKINAIESVYQQIQKNIGLQLKAIDQDPQLQAQYFEFMSHLKSEVLPPLKFLNQYQNIIKILFPIIFTLPTIDLSFFKVQSFDYSIIDEASQLSKEAGFVLLALGKIRVLAGDEAQLPPISYFQKAINDPQWGKIESILQYAKTMPIHHIPLELTYRAQWAQLMTFNAHHFYHDQLFISDVFQYQTNNSLIVKTIDASAIVKNLAAFKANPDQNEAKFYQQILKSFPNANFWELRAISSYLVKFCFDKNPDQTYQLKPLNSQVKIIVILANQTQQNALEKYLKLKFKNRLDHLQSQNLLIIKNLTNIQGIEADIVIFGITYHPQTKFNMSIFGKKWGQNALNVATSRAKNQMVVIKSISPYDIDLTSAGADLQVFQKFLMFLEQTNVQRTLYHYQMRKLNLLNPNLKHYQLKQQIKSQIEPLITNSNLQLLDDYYLATIKCDLALVDPDRNLAIALFMINEYDDLQTYWIVKDRIIYLKHRHFNVLVINEQTNWDLVENEVAQIVSYYHAKKHLIKVQSFTNEAKTHLPMRLEEITGNLDDHLLFALDETLKKKVTSLLTIINDGKPTIVSAGANSEITNDQKSQSNHQQDGINFQQVSASNFFYQRVINVYQAQYQQQAQVFLQQHQQEIDGDQSLSPIYPSFGFHTPTNLNTGAHFQPDLSANVTIVQSEPIKLKKRWWKRNGPQANQLVQKIYRYGIHALKPIDWNANDFQNPPQLFQSPISLKCHWLTWKDETMQADAKTTIKTKIALEFWFDHYDLNQEQILKSERFNISLSEQADIAYFCWTTVVNKANNQEEIENSIISVHPQSWYQNLLIFINNLCANLIAKRYLVQPKYQKYVQLINNTKTYLANYIWIPHQIKYEPEHFVHQLLAKVLNPTTFSELFSNRMAANQGFIENEHLFKQAVVETFNFDQYLTWLQMQIYHHLSQKVNHIKINQHYHAHLHPELKPSQILPQAQALQTTISHYQKINKINEHPNIFYEILEKLDRQWTTLLNLEPPKVN